MKAFRINKIQSRSLALTLFALIWSLSALADGNGGGGTGGGDVQKSTRADLEAAVHSIWDPISSISDVSDKFTWEPDLAVEFAPLSITGEPLKPELAKITQAINGTPFFAVSENLTMYILTQLKFNIVDGPCFEGTEEKDASTKFEKSAPICLSATRLSRFPKSSLHEALLPIIFHEVAHQFGFAEPEANAFQDLAALQMRYRAAYLSSLRAEKSCAVATKAKIQESDKADLLNLTTRKGAKRIWPTDVRGSAKSLGICIADAISAKNYLANLIVGENMFAGLPGEPFYTMSVSSEISILKEYAHNHDFFTSTIVTALGRPAYDSECETCKAHHVDAAYIMMLGAKASRAYIDSQVGYRQNEIVPHL